MCNKTKLSVFPKYIVTILLTAAILLMATNPAIAISNSWTFTTAGNYTYTDTDIEVTGGAAQLKAQTTNLDWYNSSWLYRQKITIDATQVPGDLTDFPVLINLASNANLAAKALANGDDILFTSSDGTTKLSHEIELYTSGTGELVAWVKAPSVSGSVDTELFMYYGNSAAANQEAATSVWDSNYALVEHMDESPADDAAGHLDSTSNSNTGTPRNFSSTGTGTTAATGKIGGADDLGGDDDYITIPDSNSLDLTSAATWEMWINPVNVVTGVIISKRNQWNVANSWTIAIGCDTGLCLSLGTNSGGFESTYTTTSLDNITADTWQHLVVTFDKASAQDSHIYINGSEVGSYISAVSANTDLHVSTEKVQIGAINATPASFFNGSIDEVRISNTARSANYIAASYNNQNSPGTFYSLTAEETENTYLTNTPSITPTSSVTFAALVNFTETATKNTGEIKYQLSNDGGTTWYWYNSGWTTTVSGYAEANTASDINTNAATFPTGSGSLKFKAYLYSDGVQNVSLDTIAITYGSGAKEASITESSSSTDVTEGGATDTYTMSLASAPTDDVVITITPDSDTTVSPTELTFTSANWYTEQTVTVTAVNDDVYEGAEVSTITHTAASSDESYNGISISNVSANVTDNDTSTITIAESSSSTDVTEGGATDTYTVVLTSEPTSNVVITPTSADETNGVTISPATLTFTSANWATPQTITVTAVNDSLSEGPHTTAISHTAASADANYDGIGVSGVTANITDNDTTTIRVATYNILYGIDPQGSEQYNALKAVLQRLNPDVIGIEEMVPADQANLETLAAELGYTYYTYGATEGLSGTDLQNAALSKYPIVVSHDLLSGGGGSDFARNPLYVEVDIPNTDTNLGMWVVHHNSWAPLPEPDPAADFVRAVEMQRIQTDITSWTTNSLTNHRNLVILGDMNEDIDDPQSVSFSEQPSGTYPTGFVLGSDITYPMTYATFPIAGLNEVNMNRLVSYREGTENQDTFLSEVNPGVDIDKQLDYIFVDDTLNALGAQAETYHSDNDVGGGLTKYGSPLGDGAVEASSDHIPVFADLYFPIISLTAPSGEFETNDEGWQISGNTDNTFPTRNATGGNVYGHICNTDSSAELMTFVAPNGIEDSFNGNYGESLRFDMKNDAVTSRDPSTSDLLITDGTTPMVYQFPAAPGSTWTTYSVPLTAAGGIKVQSTGLAPTEEALTTVLNNLTNFTIVGDWGSGAGETVCLDNVFVGKGVVVTESSAATAVTEGGATDTYEVFLKNAPSATVTITPTSADTTNGVTISPSTLSFTTANWQTPQTFTVTATDDVSVEASSTVSITHAATSADTDYNGISISSVTATVTSDDTAGVTISESGGSTSISEASATSDTYTIVLNTQPSNDVVITPTSSDTSTGATVSPSSLTFTSANWSTPQTITVTAVDDSSVEGAHNATISHTAASDDASYNGISISNTSITISDNDSALMNWLFTTAANYIYNNTYIEFSSGQAQYITTAWYNGSWSSRQKITIDSTQVAGNLTDFPVLINLTTNSDLASDALANGDDILFTSSDGTTKLNHEIESYTSATGALVAWVKVPSLSGSVDTEIYMYYGNAAATNQESITSVWDSNYVIVEHMDESPADDVAGHLDSTSNNNDGTPRNFTDGGSGTTSATGKIGGADTFGADDDYITIPDSNSLDLTSAATWEFWVNPTDTSVSSVILSKRNTYDDANSWSILFNCDSGFCVHLGTNGGRFNTLYTTIDPANFTESAWNHVIITFDKTADQNVHIYINGSEVGSYLRAADLDDDLHTSTEIMQIGAINRTAAGFANGTLDEIRMSNTARSTSYITTSYNNQNSPATFYALSSEELISTYNSTKPTIATANALTYDSLITFVETSTLNGGTIKYQVSPDNGTTWYWYNSGWTETALGYTETSTSSQINSNIATLPDGDKELSIKAYFNSDGTQQIQLDNIAVAYLDNTTPVLSSISTTVSDDGISASWTTDELSSTQIEYGLTSSYGSTTTETDTTTRVTSHSASISGLAPCTTYYYRLKSSDTLNTGTSTASSFRTTGCTIDTTVIEETASEITNASGGQVSLPTAGLTITIPASATNAESTYQAKQVNSVAVLAETSTPETYEALTNHIYELSAYSNNSTSVTSFNSAISVAITYSSDDVQNFSEGSLGIYRWNGTNWDKLNNCSNNTSTQTITCETTNFSTFALFGIKNQTSSIILNILNKASTTVKKIATSITTPTIDPTTKPKINAENTQYTDIKTDYIYYPAINNLSKLGILKGYDDQTFKPLSKINRAELMKITVLGANENPDAQIYKNCFPDVKDEWFARYVCYAKEKGWIDGHPDGSFKPNANTNFAEAIKIVINSQKIEPSNIKATNWYDPFVKKAKMLNILKDVEYQSSQRISRGESAQIINQAIIQQTK